ncbi:Rhodanese-related sulfurtransferase [Thioflavicoccus mobilis 8321]|uniref:Rhodanese-related sulfurtransferase n=1 Tax=Thioflavicoccus mobilis 8321 TaxID=765912 RepID=L0H193_9GAMM|nr:rhodanese-like domain-containing protein [Thioflavicoccus mobilis]AGA91359.1 Rhodanese-related sulfurtransferase [Thioflavicoccus mobilis 8321]
MINEIDSLDLHQQLQAGANIPLIDIRTPAETAQGIIPRARALPMHLIPLRLQELPRDREIVLYCRSGARSYHACSYLVQQGFDKVLNLRGGIADWARQGLEIALPSVE